MGVGEAKQAIATEFGWSLDRVDKVIARKWEDTYSKKREYYENAWSSLKDKSLRCPYLLKGEVVI